MTLDERKGLRARLRAARGAIAHGGSVDSAVLADLAGDVDRLAAHGESFGVKFDREVTLGLLSCAASIRFLAAMGDFTPGDKRRLTHCMVWAEGFTEPDADALRDTESGESCVYSPEDAPRVVMEEVVSALSDLLRHVRRHCAIPPMGPWIDRADAALTTYAASAAPKAKGSA